MTRLLVFIIFATAMVLPVPAYAGDSGWMPLSRVKAHLQKLKRENSLPVVIDCRNDSPVAAAWKPFVRIQTGPTLPASNGS